MVVQDYRHGQALEWVYQWESHRILWVLLLHHSLHYIQAGMALAHHLGMFPCFEDTWGNRYLDSHCLDIDQMGAWDIHLPVEGRQIDLDTVVAVVAAAADVGAE